MIIINMITHMRIFNLVYGICLWDISMEDIEFTHKIISMDILKLTTLDMIDMIYIYIYQCHQINKFLI